MNLAEYSVKNQVLSVIIVMLALAGGWSAYQTMPRFEDPEFIIRQAQVITRYPGASPIEVAKEITEPLERAIQQMQEVDMVESVSTAGLSEINVKIKYDFSPTKSDLQIIWTKLRNKVNDAARALPPGADTPIVADDYGDVYGLLYFITGDGFNSAELRRYTKQLQSDLLQVDGVAKVVYSGERKEAIFVEIARKNIATLGASVNSLYNILAQQNAVVAAGDVRIGDQRLIIDPSGAIDSVETIKNLLVSTSGDGKIIYLKDIAHVWRGYQTPPDRLVRYNGEPAIALGVAGILGGNIVEIGKAVSAKIEESEGRRPLGIELHNFYNQSDVVAMATKDFIANVMAALVIVILTLLIFMGIKSAIIIGAILILTIAASLATMNTMDIPMHRISLGALIIALGMMVDNAIVVTEGILVGVQQGRKKLDIAKEIVSQTKWPLLGGTLVGIIAFAPIGLAPGSTAEYSAHLFWVILIALLYSWLFAMTLTPLFCFWLFKEKLSNDGAGDTKNGFLSAYKKLVARALLLRWVTVGIVVALFGASLWAFKFVPAGFFPASTTPQIVVDYWLPQGTDITRTHGDVEGIEAYVSSLDGVEAVQATIGSGGIRYMLIYPPESPNPSYGQLLIRVDDYRSIDRLVPSIQQFVSDNYPAAQAKVWRFVLGPGGGSKIEATFKGSDPKILRRLANQAKAIMVDDGRAQSIKDDWRQQVSVIEPVYSNSKGRRAGISREDLALALQSTFSGKTMGVYREGDDLLPIITRAPVSERLGVDDIYDVQIISSASGSVIPISQVTDGFRTIWRDGMLRRENRVWTIKAQSDPFPDELASLLHSRLRPKIEALELPDGYTLEWDGEYGNSQESNENLGSVIPMGLLAMVLVVFVLFGKIRQPIVIWLVVPLSVIGVVLGLVITGIPLEFMAILGVLSLSGLLIKNAIVLVDQIDLEIDAGKRRYLALIEASASRVRPVMMGALTTVLGVIPLLFDEFFQSMAVVLVFGLSFATVLTLVIVPVLYGIFFNIPNE